MDQDEEEQPRAAAANEDEDEDSSGEAPPTATAATNDNNNNNNNNNKRRSVRRRTVQYRTATIGQAQQQIDKERRKQRDLPLALAQYEAKLLEVGTRRIPRGFVQCLLESYGGTFSREDFYNHLARTEWKRPSPAPPPAPAPPAATKPLRRFTTTHKRKRSNPAAAGGGGGHHHHESSSASTSAAAVAPSSPEASREAFARVLHDVLQIPDDGSSIARRALKANDVTDIYSFAIFEPDDYQHLVLYDQQPNATATAVAPAPIPVPPLHAKKLAMLRKWMNFAEAKTAEDWNGLTRDAFLDFLVTGRHVVATTTTVRSAQSQSGSSSSSLKKPAAAAGTSSARYNKGGRPKGSTKKAGEEKQPYNKGGRPKGSTKKAKLEKEQQMKDALVWVTEQVMKVQGDSSNNPDGRMPRGRWGEILLEAEAKFPGVDPEDVSYDCVKKRAQRGVPDPSNSNASPLEEVERPLLVELYLSLPRLEAGRGGDLPARRAAKRERFLQLANALIEGTDYEESLIQLKLRSCPYMSEETLRREPTLGKPYCRSFEKRHEAALLEGCGGANNSKSQQLNSRPFPVVDRPKWDAYANKKLSYGRVCEVWRDAGIVAVPVVAAAAAAAAVQQDNHLESDDDEQSVLV